MKIPSNPIRIPSVQLGVLVTSHIYSFLLPVASSSQHGGLLSGQFHFSDGTLRNWGCFKTRWLLLSEGSLVPVSIAWFLEASMQKEASHLLPPSSTSPCRTLRNTRLIHTQQGSLCRLIVIHHPEDIPGDDSCPWFLFPFTFGFSKKIKGKACCHAISLLKGCIMKST